MRERPNVKMKNRRLILLYGYCQAEAFCRILQRIPFISSRFDVKSVVHFPDLVTGLCAEPNATNLEDCEYFLYQASPHEHLPRYARDQIARGRSICFPGLYCEPVWPQHHMGTHDPRCPELPHGRFPYGDSVLLELLNSNLSEATIVEQYLRMDFSTTFDIDQLIEQWNGLLEKLDHGTDVAVAEYVWHNWRRQRLFWTRWASDKRAARVRFTSLADPSVWTGGSGKRDCLVAASSGARFRDDPSSSERGKGPRTRMVVGRLSL